MSFFHSCLFPPVLKNLVLSDSFHYGALVKPSILTPDAFAGLTREATITKLTAAAETLSLAERFMLLYQLGVYHGKESYSGPGSSLTETAALQKALHPSIAFPLY